MKQALIFLPILLTGACSVGMASAESKTYGAQGFTRIEASAGVDVTLKQGAFAVSADAPRGNIDRLLVEVRGDTLVVTRKSQMFGFSFGDDFNVTVTAPEISAIKATSGSDFESSNYTFRDLSIEASSGSDMELSGACANLRLELSSGSDVEAKELRCETVTIDASSGSDAEVYASKSVHGEASSGADVRVHGNPAEFQEDSSSGGSVERSN